MTQGIEDIQDGKEFAYRLLIHRPVMIQNLIKKVLTFILLLCILLEN